MWWSDRSSLLNTGLGFFSFSQGSLLHPAPERARREGICPGVRPRWSLRCERHTLDKQAGGEATPYLCTQCSGHCPEQGDTWAPPTGPLSRTPLQACQPSPLAPSTGPQRTTSLPACQPSPPACQHRALTSPRGREHRLLPSELQRLPSPRQFRIRGCPHELCQAPLEPVYRGQSFSEGEPQEGVQGHTQADCFSRGMRTPDEALTCCSEGLRGLRHCNRAAGKHRHGR